MVEVNNLNVVVTEDDSDGSDETTNEEVLTTDQFRRDEVKEVRKLSSKDTSRLRSWRIVVTGVLLLTAFAITFTTYTLLKQQEEKNFQTAVSFLLHKILLISARLVDIFTYVHALPLH